MDTNTRQATVNITTTRKVSGRVVEQKEATKKEDVVLPPHPAHVSYGLKFTANTGNYNSVGASVTVTLPCGTSDSELEAAKGRARDLANAYLDEAYSDMLQGETHHR